MTSSGFHFPKEFLDAVRARLRVSTVVGRSVTLTKRGHEYVGLSPFSHEKTPSFTVNDQEGFYHCFSTQEHGDIFTFLMKTQNLTFPEAVETLAEEAGLEVPRKSKAEAERAAKTALLMPVVEAACGLYEEALWSPQGASALAYLRGRGLVDETIKRFRLGYAPPGNYLKERFLARGTAEYMLLDTRLVSPGKDGRESFDFFRDRVMFPIFDPRGRPVAFGGRVMGDGEPKYLNSADTPLFHKGSLLYGLSLAREAAVARKEIIVVEGYMDVIAMAQAGFVNTVAPLGTALTENQLGLLWRYAAEPLLCFDGDKAGRGAAGRAADRALPLLTPGQSLRFATLPAGKDPDDVCKDGGADALRRVLSDAVTLSQAVWLQLVEKHPADTPERRAGFQRACGEKAALIADETVRGAYRAFFQDQARALFKHGEEAGDMPSEPRSEGSDPPYEAGGEAENPHHDPDADGPTPEYFLGPHCPIKVSGYSLRGVGQNQVKLYHFIDTEGQSRSLSPSALRMPTNVLDLFFGHEAWLESVASNKVGEVPLPGDRMTWKATMVVPMLMRACHAAGYFEPQDKLRGPGVWPYGRVKDRARRDPRVVVHLGDRVYVVRTDQRPVKPERHPAGSRIGDFVYCRRPAEDNPFVEPALTDDEAHAIIRFYDCWTYEETARVGDVSLTGFLLFGWAASAGLSALLKHRPHLFARGKTKVGKSELITFHEHLLGTAAIRMENATMSGIRQEFMDPQPVRALLCNEANDRGNPQLQEQLRQVLDLALYLYTSGEGNQLRGPGGISGNANATFMFAAGRPPMLISDDANRMLLVNLLPRDRATTQSRADFEARRDELLPLGPRLRRRMIERWGDFSRVFAAFEAKLFGKGFDERQADTFGTLMTCAWVGSRVEMPSDKEAEDLAQAVSVSSFVLAAEESEPEWKKCWIKLMTAKVEWMHDRSVRSTVGDLIEHVLTPSSASFAAARTALKGCGLAVVRRQSKVEAAEALKAKQPPPPPRDWIAVAYGHDGLEEIFKASDWKGGKWNAALAQMPGAEKNHPATFAGQKRGKATLLPLSEVKEQEGDTDYADDPEEALKEAERRYRERENAVTS